MTFSNFNTTASNNPLNESIVNPVGVVFAGRNPASSDNTYTRGQEWQNTVSGQFWKCLSPGLPGAVWVAVTGPSPFGGILTINSVPPTAAGNLLLTSSAATIAITNPSANTINIDLIGGSTAIDTLHPSHGIDVVPTVDGLVNVPDGNGTKTTGTLNTLTIDMNSPFTSSSVVDDFVFTKVGAGVNQSLTIQNTSTAASSNTVVNVIGNSTSVTQGDPWYQVTIGASQSYAFGIDASDSRKLKITSAAGASVSPSSALVAYSFDPSTNISVFSAGNVYVQAPSGGGTPLDFRLYNTAATSSDARLSVLSTIDAGNFSWINIGEWDGAATFKQWQLGHSGNTDQFSIGYTTGNGDPSGGTRVLTATTAGWVTMPGQPSFNYFQAATNANQTGDATTFLLGDSSVGGTGFTKEFDQSNSFTGAATAGGVFFTAPVTGKYRFNVFVGLTGLAATHTNVNLTLVATGKSYGLWSGNAGSLRDASNNAVIGGSILIPLSAAQTVRVSINAGPNTAPKTVGVLQNSTIISGDLEE